MQPMVFAHIATLALAFVWALSRCALLELRHGGMARIAGGTLAVLISALTPHLAGAWWPDIQGLVRRRVWPLGLEPLVWMVCFGWPMIVAFAFGSHLVTLRLRTVFCLLCLSLCCAAVMPAKTLAQEIADPPALVVTIRDEEGRVIAGVTCVIYDRSGSVEFARVLTNQTGSATFARLPTADIRVMVSGQAPDGQALQMAHFDAIGIAFTLSLPPNQLDLRIEADGTVLPDPTTMLALETGPPVDQAVLIPTAPLMASPTEPAFVPIELPTTTLVNSSPPVQSSPANTWLGFGIVVALGGIAVGLLVLVGRWR